MILYIVFLFIHSKAIDIGTQIAMSVNKTMTGFLDAYIKF